MNFSKKIKQLFGKPRAGFVALVLFFAVSGVAFAQLSPNAPVPGPGFPDTPGLNRGDVIGYAWMGTGIENPNSPEGGGGWLKFNCAPDSDCGVRGGVDWGVHVELDDASSQYGYFSGNAWSNNYGWLSFDPRTVSSCWNDNPTGNPTFDDVAHVFMPRGKISGWAKFIAGDDFPSGASNDDGWDGCVNFSRSPYVGTTMNLETGVLEGWAWGSDVVGWISFQNPECPLCDATVVLDEVVDIDFWADDTTVPVGGGTTLHWSAANTPTNSVVSCPSYDNTSGYNHWENSIFGPIFGGNVGEISVSEGNLPIGEHPISGINEETTYELTCTDSNGETLPTKYVTITTEPRVLGCMDPLASNYNPLANVPARCSYVPNTETPTVQLQIITDYPPNFLPVGSTVATQYNTSPRWTFTSPTQVGAPYCTGSFKDQNGVTQTLPGWTGADLDRPSAVNNWSTGVYSLGGVNVSAFAPGVVAGEQFTYTITCTDIAGAQFSDSDVVSFMAPVSGCTNPIASNYNPLATIDDGSCRINGGGPRTDLTINVTPDTFFIGLPPADYIANPITWTSNNPSDIAPNSCQGYFNVVGSSISNLPGWTGAQAAPTTANPVRSVSNINVPIASTLTNVGDQVQFTISCTTLSGTIVFDRQQIQMIDPIVNPSEPPSLWLNIIAPNTNGSLVTETIPAVVGVNPLTLRWQGLNVDPNSCVGDSERYNGTTAIGPNPSWNALPLSLDFQGYGVRDLDITIPTDIKNTQFQIKCHPINSPTTWISAQVCMGVDGIPFPSSLCSAGNSGSRPPGYKEI